MADQRAEHRIPWAQIEPLTRECATTRDLVVRVLSRAGLPPERYALCMRPPSYAGEPIIDMLRDGVTIHPLAEVAYYPLVPPVALTAGCPRG